METFGVTLTPMAGPRLKTGDLDKRRSAPGYMTTPAGEAVTRVFRAHEPGWIVRQLRSALLDGSRLVSIYGLGLRDP